MLSVVLRDGRVEETAFELPAIVDNVGIAGVGSDERYAPDVVGEPFEWSSVDLHLFRFPFGVGECYGEGGCRGAAESAEERECGFAMTDASGVLQIEG